VKSTNRRALVVAQTLTRMALLLAASSTPTSVSKRYSQSIA